MEWLGRLEARLPELAGLPGAARQSIERAVTVLRRVVLTAGITATTDLWLLKHVLATHRQLGTFERLRSGRRLDPELYAAEQRLDLAQLKTDLQFLYARGYLQRGDGDFAAAAEPAIRAVFQQIEPIPDQWRINVVPLLTEWLSTAGLSADGVQLLRAWTLIDQPHRPTGTWVASAFQIELGYRLLPVVLALRVLEITQKLQRGERIALRLPKLPPEIGRMFALAGLAAAGEVTELGARVFERGPGAFGIIGAYHPYLNQHKTLLKSGSTGTWVHRGENVAASQDANRKTFQIANDMLDRFCEQHGYRYTVFIEHAVGRGEAIRQRYSRNPDAALQYFGADLEDAAIDQAIKQQELGVLPSELRFIRSADIGEPQKVIRFLAELGLAGEPTVMMVGNGFHEIREQTNQKMVEVFRQYQQAGFVLIFTEESALHDEALIQTAWNTYHAGFRYVHEMSGQGLRPAVERQGDGGRWSWRKCATLGGYRVLDRFSYRSRTIYPFRRPPEKNPAISVTYFCVPAELADQLGL